jgi:SAM-dependent methyltransferase
VTAPNHDRAFALLTEHLDAVLPRDRTVAVVEAGCGKRWALGDLDRELHILGIDLDEEALRIRLHDQDDLDDAVHGDLLQVELPGSEYDLVFSSFVLEHVGEPEAALKRFIAWLRPGGVAVVVIPDRDTAKGFMTRVTPHWFHIFYYRWVKGRKNAGQPGFEPYRTIYTDVLGRRGLENYCRETGITRRLEIKIAINRADDGLLTVMANWVIAALSFGRLSGRYCNVIVVLEPAAAS